MVNPLQEGIDARLFAEALDAGKSALKHVELFLVDGEPMSKAAAQRLAQAIRRVPFGGTMEYTVTERALALAGVNIDLWRAMGESVKQGVEPAIRITGKDTLIQTLDTYAGLPRAGLAL